MLLLRNLCALVFLSFCLDKLSCWSYTAYIISTWVTRVWATSMRTAVISWFLNRSSIMSETARTSISRLRMTRLTNLGPKALQVRSKVIIVNEKEQNNEKYWRKDIFVISLAKILIFYIIPILIFYLEWHLFLSHRLLHILFCLLFLLLLFLNAIPSSFMLTFWHLICVFYVSLLTESSQLNFVVLRYNDNKVSWILNQTL